MNPFINLIHLKFFCDAVTYNSISEAAKMNYVTQSAISQGIIKLEKTLGTQLAIHSRQKFQLTDEGKILFEHSGQVFRSIQAIHDKLNQNKHEIRGKIKFVSTKSLGMSFLPILYEKASACLPHIEMNFRLGGLNFIRNSLRQGEAEFAIVVHDESFSQFNKKVLEKGKFHLYQNKDMPPDQNEKGILVDYFEGMCVNQLQSFLCRNQSKLRIKAEVSSWEVVARFTERKLGIGFLPDYIMANGRYPNVAIHPFKIPSFMYEICVIYNKADQLSRAACAFLDQFSLND